MKVTAPKLFFEMEGRSCVMVTNAGSGLEEEEIELELGLSIGGRSYKKQADHKKFVFVQNGIHLKNSDDAVDASFREKSHQTCSTTARSSDMSPSLFSLGGDTAEVKGKMDPKRRREIHALRRQEAKRKREEKQQKKGFGKGKNSKVDGVNEWLTARDFQANEREFDRVLEEREFEKSKTEDSGSESGNNHRLQTVKLHLSVHQQNANNHNVSAVLPVQYSHPQFSYCPPTNGFVYPCGNVNGFMMPVWFGGGGLEKNVGQVEPVLSYSFGPFKAASDGCHNLGNGYELEHGGITRDGKDKKAGSNASSICTSFEGSDHCKSSREGGVSIETRSHSIHSVAEQPLSNWSKANDAKGQVEHSAASDLIESSVVNEATSHVGKMIPSIADSSSNEPMEKAKSRREAPLADNHFSTMENPAPGPLKERSGNKGKAPKPRKNHDTPSLPYMPCVSTTGDGPDGKTINGFLYRYTQGEVSIICVCHGSSLSPAEFVQHAGGTDVPHPLRHITVIPSAIQ